MLMTSVQQPSIGNQSVVFSADRDVIGVPPLLGYATRGEVERARELLKDSPAVDERDTAFGRTALICAASAGHVEAVRLLLESRASTCERSNLGMTALLCSAAEGHAETVRLLLASRSELGERDTSFGKTALLFSAHRGHVDTVEVLLKGSAHVEETDQAFGMTALMWSAFGGRTEVVEFLVEQLARINTKDKSGRTAMSFARRQNAGSLKCLESRAEVVKTLTDSGSVYNRSSILSVGDVDKIAYVSDVEGHWDYFCNFVELGNHGVSFAKHGADHRQARTPEDLELRLDDGWHFVFGGDSCDKGPGTLRFLEAMVRFKKKYPDRVHLILGNRDINKIRWTSELAESELARFRDLPAAYWIADERQTFLAWLRKHAHKEEGIQESEVTDAMIDERATMANLMIFLQDKTMGSAGEFEFRRQELAHLQDVEASQITNDEVMRSYMASVEPGGWMREYLRLGVLGAMIGDALFVHGQIIGRTFDSGQVQGASEDGVAWCITCVPGEENPIEDIHEWLRRLNAWASTQIEEWEKQPTWTTPPKEPTYEAWRTRGASDLIAYGCPGSQWPTVVYTKWLTDKSMPLKYPPELVQYLEEQGVRFVVLGHIPHGNCPTAIPNAGVTTKEGVVIVMGDTSFSHMKSNKAFPGDNRGCAASAITFRNGKCQVQGYTERNEIVDYEIGGYDGDQYIGQIQDGNESQKVFFVKARLPICPDVQEESYLLCHVNEFIYDYAVLTEAELQEALRKVGMEIASHRVISNPGNVFGFSFLGDDSAQLVHEFFQLIDRDGDGIVTKSELLAACTNSVIREALIFGFPDMNMDSIFKELHKSGVICESEFRTQLESTQVLSRSLKNSGIYFEAVLQDQGGAKSKPFPHTLGPFRLHETRMLAPADLKYSKHAKAIVDRRQLGLQCEVSRETLERTEAMRTLIQQPLMNLDGEPLRSYLTAVHEVTVPLSDRQTVGIPDDALTFAFCHPFANNLLVSDELGADSDVAFLLHGGFVFFNGDHDVISLKSMEANCDGGLRFGRPMQLHERTIENLRSGDRWHPVTDQHLIEAGAIDFCWIHSNEPVHILRGETISSSYGGFAYLGSRLRGTSTSASSSATSTSTGCSSQGVSSSTEGDSPSPMPFVAFGCPHPTAAPT